MNGGQYLSHLPTIDTILNFSSLKHNHFNKSWNNMQSQFKLTFNNYKCLLIRTQS